MPQYVPPKKYVNVIHFKLYDCAGEAVQIEYLQATTNDMNQVCSYTNNFYWINYW